MKNNIFNKTLFFSVLLTFSFSLPNSQACTVPTVLTLNYTFTEATAGQTVEIIWASDCPDALMNISLLNVDLWQTQQTYYNVPNTGSFMFTTNSNLPLGESGFYIEDIAQNIWNYGPYFDLLGPLPVEFIHFNGDLEKDNSIKLNWSTAGENNNSGFEIERSEDGLNWKKIDFVKGFGTSHDIQVYEYLDEFPNGGNNYYRLRQIDFNGEFEYSEIVVVAISKTDSIRIFPNPTTGIFQISGLEVQVTRIKIINGFGKVVSILQYESDIEIDISDLPSSIYFIVLDKNNDQFIQRIVKQ